MRIYSIPQKTKENGRPLSRTTWSGTGASQIPLFFKIEYNRIYIYTRICVYILYLKKQRYLESLCPGPSEI